MSLVAGIPTNQMFKEIDRIRLFMSQLDVNVAIHNESYRLKNFGVLSSDFDSIAADVNGVGTDEFVFRVGLLDALAF